MKKTLIFLSGLLFAIPAWSAQLLNTDASVLEILVPQYFTTEESQKSALITYKERLQANGGNGVSAEDITAVCAIGGADKAKCQSFINDMYRFSKFYAVCDGASVPSGSKGVCEKKFFSDTEVQITSGIQLVKEYAKLKLNDTIICSGERRKKGLQDYLQCRSVNSDTFYEFEFDDLTESVDYDIQEAITSAICRIFDKNHAGGLWCPGNADACSKMNTVAKSFGATVAPHPTAGGCEFKFESIQSADALRTACNINSFEFCREIEIKSDLTLQDYLKQYTAEKCGTNKALITCDSSFKTYRGSGCKVSTFAPKDDIITCYYNGTPIDYVFDDVNEALKVRDKGGKQAMSCIVSGGTYNGSQCMHLSKMQCEQLAKANQLDCPSCKKVKWNEQENICELPSSESANDFQRGVVITGIVVGFVAGAVITVATGGTGTTAIVLLTIETVGTGIELTSQLVINQIAEKFFTGSAKCHDAKCAERIIGESLQRLANYTNDLTQAEERAIDDEMARLVSMIPEDSEFFKKVYEEGITLAEREKGFFDAESWEPEQVWRAIGITLQLASIITTAGKWILTKGKTVTKTLTKTEDILRTKLAFNKAKHLNEADEMIALINQQRQAKTLTKSQADALWSKLKTVQQNRQTILNSIGNPPEELLVLLKNEAYAGKNLEDAQAALAKIIQQEDALYMTNKNGQRVLRQGKTKQDIKLLATQHDEIAKQIDNLGKELDDLDKQIMAYLNKNRKTTTEVVTTVIPGRPLLDDGISNSAKLAHIGILEAKNQTRKQTDNEYISNADNSATPGPDPESVPVVINTVVPEVPTPNPAPAPAPVPDYVAPAPAPVPDYVAPAPAPVPDYVAPAPLPGYVAPPVISTPQDRTITPYHVEKQPNTALIATASVLGAVGVGGLIGGLVGMDKDDDNQANNQNNNMMYNMPVQQNTNATGYSTITAAAAGVIGYVDNSEVTLVSMPTTNNSQSKIVNIQNNAIIVANWRGHYLPYYTNSASGRWIPIMGIGERGGWFNVYPSGNIALLDNINQAVSSKLNPGTVSSYMSQIPHASQGAYTIINAEFPNGVVQSYNGTFTPTDQTLYNNNYYKIKNLK